MKKCKNKLWLKDTIKEAQKSYKKWPKWMRDQAYWVGTNTHNIKNVK